MHNVFVSMQYHTWFFKPGQQQKYVLKPALIVWGQGQSSKSSAGKKKEFLVRALGEGSLGEIQVKKMMQNTPEVKKEDVKYLKAPQYLTSTLSELL